MGAKASDQEDTISDINIVPLVDIILVVLIIFMVTAPAFVKPSIPVNLPQAGSADATEPSTFNISVSVDGRYSFNGREGGEDVAREVAREELERNPEVQVVIAADRDVGYGQVIQVMDWVKSEGIAKFSVTTDRPLSASAGGQK